MTFTVKSLVQEFCQLRGLPVPSAVVGTLDKSTVQHLAVLKSVLRELLQYNWNQNKAQITFTSNAISYQGQIDALAGGADGFSSLLPDTVWNTTQRIRYDGPVTDETWAAISALQIAGPPYIYYVGGGGLSLSPAPAAGDTIVMYFNTNYSIMSGGTTPSTTITSDDDTILFPDDVLLKGFEAIWKKQKGEPYTDDWNDFQGLIAKGKVAFGMPTLQMDQPLPRGAQPQIFVPPGNWPL